MKSNTAKKFELRYFAIICRNRQQFEDIVDLFKSKNLLPGNHYYDEKYCVFMYSTLSRTPIIISEERARIQRIKLIEASEFLSQ